MQVQVREDAEGCLWRMADSANSECSDQGWVACASGCPSNGVARGEQAVALAEVMRGACRGTTPQTRGAVWEAMASIMEPLLALAPVFREVDATHRLLKVAAAAVEFHGDYLQGGDKVRLWWWVGALLREYAIANRGSVSVAASQALQHQFELQRGREVRALLRLLTSLALHDDQPDISSQQTGTSGAFDTTQAVLEGLQLIAPEVTDRQLAVPKTARRWFGLLAFLLVTCPARVVGLSGSLFGQLMEGLQKGLTSADVEVASECANGLESLSAFHYAETLEGRPGLAAHDTPGVEKRTLVRRLLEGTLQRAVMGDGGCDAADRCSPALLALILSEPAAFGALGEALVAQQHDPVLATQLSEALQGLMASKDGHWSLSRTHKIAFCASLRAFLSKARCIIRLK